MKLGLLHCTCERHRKLRCYQTSPRKIVLIIFQNSCLSYTYGLYSRVAMRFFEPIVQKITRQFMDVKSDGQMDSNPHYRKASLLKIYINLSRICQEFVLITSVDPIYVLRLM